MEEVLKKEPLVGDNDVSLRPLSLSSYCGQEKIKKNVSVFIQSAKIRKCSLDHMLFYGPPGLGKTTIAGVIAHEMGKEIKTTSAPAIERPGDLAALLMGINAGDIVFIDEIHRLPKVVEEVLYSVMEDFAIDVVVGEADTLKAIRLDVPRFTLLGATTRVGAISSPLRDRFGSTHRLELYSVVELTQIIQRDAGLLNISISPSGAKEIALRSRGTPRIAIRLLKRVLDYAVVGRKDGIDLDIACTALEALDIDDNGLDDNDLRVLNAVASIADGAPVGLDTISAFLGEDTITIEDVCEPFLMQLGFIVKTPKGRMITSSGSEYISKAQKK